MRSWVITVSILGSIVVGLYVANTVYVDFMLSKFMKPRFEVVSAEEMEVVPHKMLAEHAENLIAILQSEEQLAKEQQQRLRQAMLALSAWSFFLLVLIVLSRTKALNKFSLPRPGKSPGAGLADARRS